MQEVLFSLTWLIPLFPLLAFFAIILFTGRSRHLSHGVAIGAIALSWALGWAVAFCAFCTPYLEENVIHWAIPWFPTGTTTFPIGIYVDPLTAVALFMVPFVCLMIFVYSVGYMHGDPRYTRFFAYISLFAAGMLGLVVSENLLTLFISWEVMGLCSYLLIGFWYEKESAYRAGLKAFIVTKIGDAFFLLGILYLYSQTGSLSYGVIFSERVLHTLAEHTVTLPLLGTWTVASLIALLIFGGTVGKSAQFPLHVWLPDAMEGPTPVSALIHAATMVSAGIFLLARIFPLLSVVEPGTPTLGVIAFIGAFTAIFASVIAVAQDDIKRVLAFSTISQLGYMVAALGIGGYVAAVFHLITHAFFKALLFLGSGSVIIGCHHEMNMKAMGGLRHKMPITFWTFVTGGLALSGFPLMTSGFWSKDEILAHAWHEFTRQGIVSWPFFVWLMLTLAAGLTAFYTARQICLTFLGQPRSHQAEHAHESPWTMTIPLVMLAFFAIFLGFAGVPEEFPLLGSLFGHNWLHHFAGGELPATPLSWPVMGLSSALALGGLGLGWLVYGRKPLLAGQMDPLERAMRQRGLGWLYQAARRRFYFDELYQVTIVRFVIQLSRMCYHFDKHWVAAPLVNLVGRVTRLAADVSAAFDRVVIDGLVNLSGRAGIALSTLSRWTDDVIVDGVVNGLGRATGALGRALRPIQTGKVQNYLLVAMMTIMALAGLYIFYH
ncbi:MAG: NADH-quinone oxidoreductase subunit L [Anaerolineae bacterium]|jgi:NADH-quinone oxidoreductase subunit L|nr:NADH-quinone oxidoreductase subunit L [Anaerolineae bacterium]MDH7474855.1 NADH-quinone oxidoreductase subunit L [Anaerolineae bacterium]